VRSLTLSAIFFVVSLGSSRKGRHSQNRSMVTTIIAVPITIPITMFIFFVVVVEGPAGKPRKKRLFSWRGDRTIGTLKREKHSLSF